MARPFKVTDSDDCVTVRILCGMPWLGDMPRPTGTLITVDRATAEHLIFNGLAEKVK
jgi:hypothetical protein